MTETPEENALAAILAAGEVISEMNRRFEEQDNKMRAAGLDPAKVRAASAAQLSEKARGAVDEMLKPELEAAERAAEQASGEQEKASPRSKPRNMV